MINALIGVVVLIGWVINIVHIVHTLAAPLTGLFVLRCVGILVPPLGAVLGYFF